MKQLPIYIVALAAVATIGMPAAHAQATSPADANHPGSQPAFSAQSQQPAQPAAQAPQQGGQPTAQSQQQRRQSAPTAARRAQPATTGSGSQQR